jgi:VCBS repeat-containing protein
MASAQISAGSDGRALVVALTDGTAHTSPCTNAVASDYVYTGERRYWSIAVANGASETATFTVQGSNDASVWFDVAYGQGSSNVYTKSALTAVAATNYLLNLPADDVFAFLRVNITDSNGANGTAFTVCGKP